MSSGLGEGLEHSRGFKRVPFFEWLKHKMSLVTISEEELLSRENIVGYYSSQIWNLSENPVPVLPLL